MQPSVAAKSRLSSIRVQRQGRDHWLGGAGSSSSMFPASLWPRGRAKLQSALFLVPEVGRGSCPNFSFSLHSRISLLCARDFWSREVVCWKSEQCFGGGFGAPAQIHQPQTTESSMRTTTLIVIFSFSMLLHIASGATK